MIYSEFQNNPDRLKTFKDKDQKYVDGIIDYFSDDSKRALNLQLI